MFQPLKPVIVPFVKLYVCWMFLLFQVTEIKQVESRGTPARGNKPAAKKDFVDPLSSGDPLGADGAVSLAFEGADPLSRFAAEAEPAARARSSSEKVEYWVMVWLKGNWTEDASQPVNVENVQLLTLYNNQMKPTDVGFIWLLYINIYAKEVLFGGFKFELLRV